MIEPDLLRSILIDPCDDVPRLIYADWLEENGDEKRAQWIRRSIENPDLTIRVDFSRKFKSHVYTIMRRGFYESIHCYTNSLFDVLDEFFTTDPITSVTVADKSPRNWIVRDPPNPPINCSRWWAGLDTSPEILDLSLASDALPIKIFSKLRNQLGHMSYPTEAMLYRTHAEAMEDLSQACVACGRELAGLPPLTLFPPNRTGGDKRGHSLG